MGTIYLLNMKITVSIKKINKEYKDLFHSLLENLINKLMKSFKQKFYLNLV